MNIILPKYIPLFGVLIMMVKSSIAHVQNLIVIILGCDLVTAKAIPYNVGLHQY